MAQATHQVTFKGSPVTLEGAVPTLEQKAPAFTVTGNDLADFGLEKFEGKVVLISVVPSLDTGVCDQQTRRFNEEAGKLDGDLVVLTLSMDLPFAQKRWCGAADARNIITASDYKDHAFGKAFGVRIQELGLLTRSVFVVGKDRTIKYAQIVKEVTEHPDYDAAIAAAKAAI